MARAGPKIRLDRASILEAAGGLIGELGYDRTSLKLIGQRLGVSGAALYYHFQSKEEILFAYLEAGLRAVLQLTRESMTGSTPTERLRQLVRVYVLFDLGELRDSKAYSTGVHAYFQLIEVLDNDKREQLRLLQREYLDLLSSTIEEGANSGEFDVGEDTSTVFAISGMAMTACLWYRSDRHYSGKEIADHYAGLALRMVGAG